jgi:cysteinyl-tRNA synthetase
MLELAEEKMSKSLGNVVTLRSVLDRWGREALLVFHLTGAWSKPVDFSDEVMEQAAARADRFREVFRNPHVPAPTDAWGRFTEALDDDFSTPAALAVMHEWRDHELLRRALAIFGLESLAEEAHAPAEIVELAERRQSARAAQDFAEADRIRDELAQAGWEARDEADGFRLVRLGS